MNALETILEQYIFEQFCIQLTLEYRHFKLFMLTSDSTKGHLLQGSIRMILILLKKWIKHLKVLYGWKNFALTFWAIHDDSNQILIIPSLRSSPLLHHVCEPFLGLPRSIPSVLKHKAAYHSRFLEVLQTGSRRFSEQFFFIILEAGN